MLHQPRRCFSAAGSHPRWGGNNLPSPSRLRLNEGRICLSLTLSAWRRHSSSSRGLSFCVTPRPPHGWRRIINLLPIGYASRPHLRVPAYPTLIYIGSETLGFRRTSFSLAFAATHARILTTLQSMPPLGGTSPRRVRSPTAYQLGKPAASVARLAPLNFRRRAPRRVSCYALFKGWLPLSQPPRCLRSSTSFPT